VELAGQSPGFNLALPERQANLDGRALDKMCSTREEVAYGWRHVVWWGFHEAAISHAGTYERTAKEMLADIVSRHVETEAEHRRIYGSISSVIGAANSMAKREGLASAPQLHARFRSRFAVSRNMPQALLDDPEFARWLERRASELGG
jgi:hypothetical protein